MNEPISTSIVITSTRRQSLLKVGEYVNARVALNFQEDHVPEGTRGEILDMNITAGRALVRFDGSDRLLWTPLNTVSGFIGT